MNTLRHTNIYRLGLMIRSGILQKGHPAQWQSNIESELYAEVSTNFDFNTLRLIMYFMATWHWVNIILLIIIVIQVSFSSPHALTNYNHCCMCLIQ